MVVTDTFSSVLSYLSSAHTEFNSLASRHLYLLMRMVFDITKAVKVKSPLSLRPPPLRFGLEAIKALLDISLNPVKLNILCQNGHSLKGGPFS
jgi:hypothetical protein